MATLFTKIINKEIPADIVYEDDDVIAFKDIAPVAPVHVLVVPKKEIPTINDITDEDALLIGKIYKVIGKLAKKFGIDKDGYRVVSNCNENAGQTVFHFHIHIIPRYENGPEMVAWTPGKAEPEELKATAESIRKAL